MHPLKTILLLVFIFSLSLSVLSQKGVAINLYVQHSDSLVVASVKVNGIDALYNAERKQYVLHKKLLQEKGNILSIYKKGYAPERLNIDSIFKSHQQNTEVTVAVRLKHRWDTVYLQQGKEVRGTAHTQSLMILGIDDTAKVFKSLKGQNLYVMSMYDYCERIIRKDQSYNYPANTYILMHCYGAPLQKKNSEVLTHLRAILGAENVGPVIMEDSSPKVLTHRVELVFVAGTTEARKNEVMKKFDLQVYYTDGNNPDFYIAEADIGMGDHIIGIAHQLKLEKDVAMVSNVLHSMVCPEN